MKTRTLTIIFSLLLLVLFFGCTESATFKDSGAQVCSIDKKPIIRMYSTTWCPHCQWVGPTFDKVVKEYEAKGLIVAHHYEVDILDDKLTDTVESSMPEEEYAEFQRVSPKGSIPAFSFGCKYTRLGNGYEAQKDLAAEEKEFRATIDKLITKAS